MGLKSFPRHHVNVGLGDTVRGACGLFGGEDSDDVTKLERRFAALIGVRHAIAVGSARTGFHHLLRALGVEGKEVVLPAFTFWGMGNVALMARGRPVFADVDRGTLDVSAETLRPVVGDDTGVLVPTHLFGNPAPMDEVLELAEERGVPVIEDCAQANGASYRDQRVGSHGTAGLFSFNLFKNMTAFGGGMVTTDDEELAEKVRAFEREYTLPGRKQLAIKVAIGTVGGVLSRPWVYSLGLYPPLRLISMVRGGAPKGMAHDEILQSEMPPNYTVRMSSLQARTGLVQLDGLDDNGDARRERAKVLTEGLRNVPGVTVPEAADGGRHIYYHYVIQVKDRQRLVQELFRAGVDTKVNIADDCSNLPALKGYARPCPVAARADAQGLALPVWHTLSERDMERTVAAVKRALA